jgi:hypothetical protein
MDRWILIVRSNCATSVEGYDFAPDDKFNDWYDNVHVPDVLKIPGFISGRRFISPDISTLDSGRYLALYEIETDDIRTTMKALEDTMRDLQKDGRLTKLLQAVSMSVFKQTMASKTA